MALTNFIPRQTLVTAEWLNKIDAATESLLEGGFSAVKSIYYYGARDDGTDCAEAIQLSIAEQGGFYVPFSLNGWTVRTPINASNLDSLWVKGVISARAHTGYIGPPITGSNLIARTDGGCLIDLVGTDNIDWDGVGINAYNKDNASKYGILMGRSDRPIVNNLAYGAGSSFRNFAILMDDELGSVPFYSNDGNLYAFQNVWMLGDYAFAGVSGNPLGIVPPYGTFGATVGTKNIIMDESCALATFGRQAPLWLDTIDAFSFRMYLVNVYGPTVTQKYAIEAKNIRNGTIEAWADYWASYIRTQGYVLDCTIKGTQYSGTTPVPFGIPGIAQFDGTRYENTRFDVATIDWVQTNFNYLYQSPAGATPILQRIANCWFRYDSAASIYISNFNFNATDTVPNWNNNYYGDQAGVATIVIATTINNVAAASGKTRMFVCGDRLGSA